MNEKTVIIPEDELRALRDAWLGAAKVDWGHFHFHSQLEVLRLHFRVTKAG